MHRVNVIYKSAPVGVMSVCEHSRAQHEKTTRIHERPRPEDQTRMRTAGAVYQFAVSSPSASETWSTHQEDTPRVCMCSTGRDKVRVRVDDVGLVSLTTTARLKDWARDVDVQLAGRRYVVSTPSTSRLSVVSPCFACCEAVTDTRHPAVPQDIRQALPVRAPRRRASRARSRQRFS